MEKSVQKQRFMEHVRNGWHWAPEVLTDLQLGHITTKGQAIAYFSVDETEGLSVEEATAAIEEAMKSPAY